MSELRPEDIDLLARLDGKRELRALFFKRAKNLKWFYPLRDRGYFKFQEFTSMQETGSSVAVPFWHAAEYLAAASESLERPENEKYCSDFMNVIREITLEAESKGVTNYRTWWCFAKVIENIPVKYVAVDDARLVDYWLSDEVESGLVAGELGEHWLEKLISLGDGHSKKISELLLKILFKIQFTDVSEGISERKDFSLRMSDWTGKKIIDKHAEKVGKLLGSAAVGVFVEGIESILLNSKDDKWSSIWRPSIAPHEQNLRSDDTEDVLIDAARKSLAGLLEMNSEEGRVFVENLIQSEFQTIQRLGIWALDSYFNLLEPIAIKFVDKTFFSSNYRHEFWCFLKNHYALLPIETRSSLLVSIETLSVSDEQGNESLSASAYSRAIWMAAIRVHSAELDKKYWSYVAAAGAEPEHPDFSSYSFGGPVIHRSAYTVEHLLSLDGDALAQLLTHYLNTYEPGGAFDVPDIEGLAKTVREAVKADPIRFHLQLEKLAGLDNAYAYEVIEGFGDLWKEKTQLPWDSIWSRFLFYIEQILQRPGFWEANKHSVHGFVGNSNWVVSSIGRLLESATRSDDHAMDKKFNQQAEKILLLILEKQAGEDFSIDCDAISLAINSPRGQAIEAFINLALRSFRISVHADGKDAVWGHFEQYFQTELENKYCEFPTLVARYLPNFIYMSSAWVFKNFDQIFSADNHLRWLCAMQGYASVTSVHKEVYFRLREGHHLIRALDDESLKDRVSEKVIQNIVAAYINGLETLDEGLISVVLERKKTSELSHLAWFIWTLRAHSDGALRDRLIALWKRINLIIDFNSKEGKLIASRVSNWIDFIDHITDDNRDLILAVAPYVDEDYNSYPFLESLARLAALQPIEVADIWLRMLVRSKPSYPEDTIRNTLNLIVRQSAEGKRKANEIAAIYAAFGNEMPAQHLINIGAA